MKKITRITAAVVLCLISQLTIAQKGASVTPSNVRVTFSEEFYSLVSPNATLSNMTDGWSTALTAEETADLKEANPARYFHYTAKSQITDLTVGVFKEKLDIEIKPLETLRDKIDYEGKYPAQPKMKKVLKTAEGEDYYLSLNVDMFKGGVGIGPDISLGANLKPTTVITLLIVDARGKEVQEFEIKEKTDIVVGKTKASVGNIEVGDGIDADEVIARTLEVYGNALNVLVEEYLKDNKKAYKNS